MSLLSSRDTEVLSIVIADSSELSVSLSASKYTDFSETWETGIVSIVMMMKLEFEISWSSQWLAGELAYSDKMSIDYD